MIRSRWQIIGIFVGIGVFTSFLCVLICAFFLIGFGNSYFICFGSFFPSLTSVERNAYFEFPLSVQNIEYDANGLNRKGGCTIWVKFEMLSTELDTLMQTTHVHDLSASNRLTGDAFSYFSSRKGWVQPSASLAGYGSPQLLTSQWVFIDTTNPEIYIVYLITNEEWL